jgi:hypothetical protein
LEVESGVTNEGKDTEIELLVKLRKKSNEFDRMEPEGSAEELRYTSATVKPNFM